MKILSRNLNLSNTLQSVEYTRKQSLRNKANFYLALEYAQKRLKTVGSGRIRPKRLFFTLLPHMIVHVKIGVKIGVKVKGKMGVKIG